MRILFFSFLLFPAVVFSQWNYKSRYTQGYYAEFGGPSRGASFNYSRVLYEQPKGFLASSAGLAYIWGYATIRGQSNPGGFQNSGLGIPLSLTYNYSLGNIDERLKNRITRKCITRPPRYYFDWFAEAGGALTPSFFNRASNEKNRIVYSGILGLRIQLKISRPYKDNDLVIFARGGISPFYDKKTFHFTQLGSLYGSLGIGI